MHCGLFYYLWFVPDLLCRFKVCKVHRELLVRTHGLTFTVLTWSNSQLLIDFNEFVHSHLPITTS